MPGPSLLSSSTQQNTARAPSPNPTVQPQQGPMHTKPNYDPFSAISNSLTSSRATTPGPSFPPQQSAQSSKSADPFASLSSPPPQPSPSLNALRSQPTSTPPPSLFGFDPPSQQNQIPQQMNNGAPADDEWNFSSALPDEGASLPSINEIGIQGSHVSISFKISRPPNSNSVIQIAASFSNKTAKLVTEYTFQVAVTKVTHLSQRSRGSWLPSLLIFLSGLHSKAYPAVGADVTTKSIEWYNPKHRNPWYFERAN